MSRVWGGTAFAKRSGAMKAPVGLLSGSAVCDSRWRGVAPTSAAPTRSLRKCRRIAEVKSRMDRKFSRIENLWPRDGSCPLPLRSKRIFNNCFRIIKAQKISRGDAAHVRGSPFAPNEVPAPVLQRRCPARPQKVWGHGAVSRSDGLWRIQGATSKKKNTAHAAQRWILSGWVGGKMNRVCCGAVASFVDFSSLKWWVSRW